ncbi:hypothetical protein HZA41_02335 [Candidatus Peregrinibacteria bacterium]|nr:hypothetical protein [Candidatus Peregrinibacteria bacterium]
MEVLRNTDDGSGKPIATNDTSSHPEHTHVDTRIENSNQLQQLCTNHLRHNVEIATEFERDRNIIEAINALLPYLFITKCVDGRVHGTRSKGLPPISRKTKIRRSDGNQFITGAQNGHFWETINELALKTSYFALQIPAITISLGHFSGTSGNLGCAAHHERSDVALNCVKEQAIAIQKRFPDGSVIPIYGMTDTDNLLHHFYFLNQQGTEINPAQIIDALNLKTPMDIFASEFLEKSGQSLGIESETKKVKDLLEGDILPFFHDISTSLHLQKFLLEAVTKEFPKNENTVLNPALLKAFRKKFTELGAMMPEALRPFFTYMMAWNMGYGLYKNQRLAKMLDKEKKTYLGHSEKLICYGEGFQTLGRNDALLVKPGQMDISIPLSVTQKVITGVRQNYPQPFPPVVHINVEFDHTPSSEEIPKILAILKTRADQVCDVFQNDVRIFTTYSTEDEKCFYPVRTPFNGHTNVDFEWNVFQGITPSSKEKDLRQAEKEYRANIMQ